MSVFQFAVASIVDANTGYGLAHGGGRFDYAAAERHGRTIRAKSIAVLYAQIKSRITRFVTSYRENSEQQRLLDELTRLDDHLLQDIGFSRADLIAAELGQVSLRQLHQERREFSQYELARLVGSVEKLEPARQINASNEAEYAVAKCA